MKGVTGITKILILSFLWFVERRLNLLFGPLILFVTDPLCPFLYLVFFLPRLFMKINLKKAHELFIFSIRISFPFLGRVFFSNNFFQLRTDKKNKIFRQVQQKFWKFLNQKNPFHQSSNEKLFIPFSFEKPYFYGIFFCLQRKDVCKKEINRGNALKLWKKKFLTHLKLPEISENMKE